MPKWVGLSGRAIKKRFLRLILIADIQKKIRAARVSQMGGKWPARMADLCLAILGVFSDREMDIYRYAESVCSLSLLLPLPLSPSLSLSLSLSSSLSPFLPSFYIFMLYNSHFIPFTYV